MSSEAWTTAHGTETGRRNTKPSAPCSLRPSARKRCNHTWNNVAWWRWPAGPDPQTSGVDWSSCIGARRGAVQQCNVMNCDARVVKSSRGSAPFRQERTRKLARLTAIYSTTAETKKPTPTRPNHNVDRAWCRRSLRAKRPPLMLESMRGGNQTKQWPVRGRTCKHRSGGATLLESESQASGLRRTAEKTNNIEQGLQWHLEFSSRRTTRATNHKLFNDVGRVVVATFLI